MPPGQLNSDVFVDKKNKKLLANIFSPGVD
jgi:hypothetical protein